MKTSILSTAIALLLSGSAFATIVQADSASSSSVASVGVQSSATSAGNGYAFQGVQAAAANQSGAGITNDTNGGYLGNGTFGVQSTVTSFAYSNGSTATSSQGVQYGNSSNQGSASAFQAGQASAEADVYNPAGSAAVNSEAENVSGSLSINSDNGFTDNGTTQYAGNVSTASVGGTITYGGSFWHPIVVGQTTNTSATSVGGTSSASHDYDIGAFGITGGEVSQSGNASAITW